MEALTQESVPHLLSAMLEEMRKARVRDDELWEAQHIADFLKLSKNTVQGKILDKNGFPGPVILPTGGRRWVAKEVRAWAMRHKG